MLGVLEEAEENEARCNGLPSGDNVRATFKQSAYEELTEYREPRKMMVGIANENATFL
jgi:hypothetical protein